MAISVMSWVWAESKAQGPDLLVLLAIADQAREESGEAWPAVSTLAGKARVSERTVQRCVRRLVDLGELEVRESEGRNGVNVYRVVMGRHTVTPTDSHPDRESPAQPEQEQTKEGVTQSPRHADGVTPVTPRGDTGVTRTVKNHQSKNILSEVPPDPLIEELCERLADRIEANGVKRPTINQRWRDACRLMLERDNRKPNEIRGAIDWCQSDEFWRANVLSMSKLREKYDQMFLIAQRARPQTAAARPGVPESVR